MKAVIILCCIAFSTATEWDYSFGPVGFPHGFGPWGGIGAGFGGFNRGGTTVVAGPTSIGFGSGRSASTPRGTESIAVGKGIGTAPHNAGQIVKVGPITSVTSPLEYDERVNAFFNGNGPYSPDGIYYSQGYGLGQFGDGFGIGGGNGLGGGYGGYSSGFGGYGLGGQGFVTRTNTAGGAGGNAEANAVGARVSGRSTGVSSSGTGRAVWTPHGIIGVADSGSSSVITGSGHFPYGGYGGGFGGGIGFGRLLGGIGGYYPSTKKF